ncbi:MAG: hypothetical protein RIF39_15970 [Cyclobacteriaceae bacterium]
MNGFKKIVLQYLFGYLEELILLLISSFTRKTEKKGKFVIFARGRSGSTLLASFLNHHPEINCDGEILSHRVAYPENFIRNKCKLSKNKIYGFKLLSYQIRSIQRIKNPNQFLRTLHSNGYKIIYLRRENLLRHALSKAYANYTGKWHSNSAAKSQIKMTVDNFDLYKSVVESEKLEKYESSVLENLPHLSLTYEDHLENNRSHQQTISNLCDFLEIPLAPFSSPLVKLSSNKFDDFVQNTTEMISFFKQTKYSKYLDQ